MPSDEGTTREGQSAIPPTVSFAHVYLNPDIRGDTLDADAARLLATLRADPHQSTPWELGDRFMLPYAYDQRSTDYLNRQFGRDFGEQLAEIDLGEWIGPLQSGLGVHLVRVDQRVERKMPTLDEARQFVLRDFLSDRRTQVNEAFRRQLRSRYEIVFDEEVQELAAADPESER